MQAATPMNAAISANVDGGSDFGATLEEPAV